MSERLDKILKPKVDFWNDPRMRSIFFQSLVMGVVVVLGLYFINNAAINMKKNGIASGFEFMGQTAGFSINQALIDYDESNSYGRAFLVSLINTILISVLGVIFATLLGFIVGIARLSSNWLIAKISEAYIEIFRNIPLLLQIFFWYFAVLRALPPAKTGINVSDAFFLNLKGVFMPRPLFESGFEIVVIAFAVALAIAIYIKRWAKKRQEKSGQQFPVFYTSLGLLIFLPFLFAMGTGFPMTWEYPVLKGFNFKGGIRIMPELVALLFALSIYTAAFIAEIVRAGILSVSHGQTEAAYSVGLKPNLTLKLIIIPQALRVIVPPLTSQYLNLTKNSSLAAAIAYPDIVLVFAGTALMQTGQAIEILGITMGVYLSLSLLISSIMNWYNRSISLKEK